MSSKSFQKADSLTLSKEEALKLPDLASAMRVLRDLGVDPKGKGIRDKNAAIALIISELEKGGRIPRNDDKRPQPSQGLRKALDDDAAYKTKLMQKYEQVQQFYSQLPRYYKADLNHVFPGLEAEFSRRRDEVQKCECTILIAGETAAGKTSLVNLLLGGVDLMPTSALGCTSTIVEIRTSKDGRREAIAFYRSSHEGGKKSRKAPPEICNLNDERGVERFKKFLTTVDEDGDSPFDRVELYWPFPMMEEGLVIVDTPGIGGGGKLGKYAERYLAKSYGLIYVINSANAGGVQKGRLQNFMRLVLNAAGEDGFDNDSTVFVCNRWEQIPDKDKASVQEDTFEKLSRFYKRLKPAQVHYMSVAEATRARSYNTVIPEDSQLQDKVAQLLPDSLRTRLNVHYRWLSAVLKRALFSLKVSKVMAAKSMEKNREEFQQVQQQIEKLERNARDSINYLKSSIATESNSVANAVKDALRTRQIADRIFAWRPEECPRTDDKKKLAKEALERIASRISVVVNAWEKEMGVVHGIKEKIVRVFKRDFELMEDQIAKLEGVLLDGDSKIVQDLHKSIKKQAPVKQLWKKAKEGSVDDDIGAFKGLGGAVASVSTLSASDKIIKNIFKDYKLKDPGKCVSKMQEATEEYVKSIFEGKYLNEKLQKFFTRFTKGIDAVAKMIPDFLKSDMQLIEILQEQIRDSEGHLRDMFPAMISQCHIMLGQLDLFYVNSVMKFDYKMEDLDWDASEAPIGCGSFADVYTAEIKSAGRKGKTPVALKVCRDALKENTVTDILLEDRTLRDLDHKNIVRYYGAMFRYSKQRKRDMQWVMIMEVCKYTLKQKFVNPDVNNPGKLTDESSSQLQAMLAMADFALQLCEGLLYLHEKGFVHRDLKLENILVTDRDVIKLTDVGLAKPKVEIAFSVVGSPVYMAPEVLLQTQNYDHKADIYSLAIVLWEMWYGRDAANYIQDQLFGTLENAIKDGLRPSLNIPTKPRGDWHRLIAASWEYEPRNRPPVVEHCRFFESFIKENRRR